MGSKRRIAKHILPIILKDRTNETFVDLFCGGCNLLENVTGNRIANDINPYLIALISECVEGWKPDFVPTKEQYFDVRANKDKYPRHIVGFYGFICAFRACFFHGYANELTQNRMLKNLLTQAPKLKGTKFFNLDYEYVIIPENSIVYCDIPYKNKEKYDYCRKFDYERFYNWALKNKEKYKIFISEFEMPNEFTCVWETDLNYNLSNKNNRIVTEKLWTPK